MPITAISTMYFMRFVPAALPVAWVSTSAYYSPASTPSGYYEWRAAPDPSSPSTLLAAEARSFWCGSLQTSCIRQLSLRRRRRDITTDGLLRHTTFRGLYASRAAKKPLVAKFKQERAATRASGSG